MFSPEDIEQVLVRDNGGIIVYLDGLSMVADVVIRRVFAAITGIACSGTNYAVETAKTGVWSPESAQGKGGCFSSRGGVGIYPGERLVKHHSIFLFCDITAGS